MQVQEVQDSTGQQAFIAFPKQLYRNDPNWICPLDNDILSVFDPQRNPFHKHGKCKRWLLRNAEGVVIGRIAAFINLKKAYLTDTPTGGCGFFECVDDREAAKLLFDTASEWLRQEGMKVMLGPINFGENDRWWGLLIEGFTRPYYGMNYNPAYYRRLFEDYGFSIVYEQISNRIDLTKPFPERFSKIARWVSKRPGYSFDYLRKDQFEKYAAEFMEIYNDGWKDFENFTPLEAATVRETFRQIKPVVDEKLIWFAYVDGEPASFVMILPDTNEWIKNLNGRLGVAGKLKFLWNRLTIKPSRMRAIIMGTKEKFRNHGLESALFIRLGEYVLPLRQYQELELSWVGDFNDKMIALHEATGATFAKRHATYQKAL